MVFHDFGQNSADRQMLHEVEPVSEADNSW